MHHARRMMRFDADPSPGRRQSRKPGCGVRAPSQHPVQHENLREKPYRQPTVRPVGRNRSLVSRFPIQAAHELRAVERQGG